jgi:hypothetical protein
LKTFIFHFISSFLCVIFSRCESKNYVLLTPRKLGPLSQLILLCSDKAKTALLLLFLILKSNWDLQRAETVMWKLKGSGFLLTFWTTCRWLRLPNGPGHVLRLYNTIQYNTILYSNLGPSRGNNKYTFIIISTVTTIQNGDICF